MTGGAVYEPREIEGVERFREVQEVWVVAAEQVGVVLSHFGQDLGGDLHGAGLAPAPSLILVDNGLFFLLAG